MPYITKKRREDLEYDISNLEYEIRNEGELNYVFSRLAKAFVHPLPNYPLLNTVMGVFESAKQEFYRRVVAPYEDKKIQENGDVF